jgi:hypothetical protein
VANMFLLSERSTERIEFVVGRGATCEVALI